MEPAALEGAEATDQEGGEQADEQADEQGAAPTPTEVDTVASVTPPPKRTTAVPSTPKRRPASSKPAGSPFDDGPPPVAGSGFEQPDGEDALLYVVPERTSVESYASTASDGSLSPGDIQVLESVQPSDGSYTRSRALLLMNAEKNKNSPATGKYLSQIMSLEENRYNPVFLSKRARWYANQKKYSQALQDAHRAEQHWARIAPGLQFETKIEIYEVTAASQQGLFYASEDDLEILDKAVKAWKKYGAHAQSRQRMDLVARAEEQIGKLEYAKERLE